MGVARRLGISYTADLNKTPEADLTERWGPI